MHERESHIREKEVRGGNHHEELRGPLQVNRQTPCHHSSASREHNPPPQKSKASEQWNTHLSIAAPSNLYESTQRYFIPFNRLGDLNHRVCRKRFHYNSKHEPHSASPVLLASLLKRISPSTSTMETEASTALLWEDSIEME